MADLYDVIEDAVSDASLPPEEPEVQETPEVETPAEVTPEVTETPAEPISSEVPSPGSKTKPEVKGDDFEKKSGIPAEASPGRENRIPYSRVKKITEKAVAEAVAAKVKELETTQTPKLAEYEGKVKDYEARLERVDQFEKVMVNEPDKFLRMLSTVPAYAQFFKAVEEAFKGGPAAQPEVQPVADDMPTPDQELSDGTKVYSMEGLKALNAWNRAQARKEVMDEVSKRYAPMESEWQANQRVQALIPQVQAQIAEAKTWPLFSENEDEIVKALQANQKLSLEGAYRQIVFPKLTAEKDALKPERDKMRAEILEELKKAPRSTSAPTSASKAAPVSAGPRSLEEIIAEAASINLKPGV